MIRALRYTVTLLGATIYYGIRMILAGLAGVPYRRGGVYDTIPRAYGNFLLRANGLSVTVAHAERLVGVQPCVYVANHQSWVDAWTVVSVLPDSVRFTPKKELMRLPLFGQALRAGKHIAIDRQHHDRAVAAIDSAEHLVRGGISAVVFPEGTRSRDGHLHEFKKGPFVLAIEAQVPVVPMWITGTREVLPRGSIMLRPGPIVLRVGEAISTSGLNYDDRDRLSGQAREAMLALAGEFSQRGETSDS
jgi:1-acyl-sn-glycerol-3-phosphate acyltransferase